jgi:hypothetical protein
MLFVHVYKFFQVYVWFIGHEITQDQSYYFVTTCAKLCLKDLLI